MFLVNSAMVDLQIGTAGLVALLGYAVVFVGLIALMVVILIEGKIAVSKNEKAEAPKAAAPAAAGLRLFGLCAPPLALYESRPACAAALTHHLHSSVFRRGPHPR